ncbi:hypothetical protein HELRODRAFT_76849 [Helobdella robusta]|uniref:Amino acid permease/ SLC12A domain-containing protein n=1 Tax=Helobdella robusta TaxID=6412 RepID=T1G2Q1_HELRO|nr:hypothetical protein HELRODRAFT_76849 [Helobdella robusta]ESO06946.1 hypothetical protein HELRODRAFT_76849 [Helobdella robusta]
MEEGENSPWWRSTLNLSSPPILFGAWDGVFTSCMLNIFGVVIFLRTGWIVGNAGMAYTILIIILTEAVSIVTVLSAIGISHKSRIICTGGVYTLISHVLGSKVATPIALLYCFGQAIACSLCVLAFGESITNLLGWNNIWMEKLIACAALLFILGVAVLGVSWMIGLQILLIIILFIAILDFIVGSFFVSNPASGVVGYNRSTLIANIAPLYVRGENFFTILGVFFPMSCGVLAGFNMSIDVRNPPKDIPKGSLGAIGISTGIYFLIGLILAATCERSFLVSDYMIAEKISGTGILWLIGLYELSLSSAVGNLTGCPQALQGLAADQVFKILKPLATGKGPNKVPVIATAFLALVSLIFILIGQLNSLSQVTTILFLLTYATVNYAYFLLSVSIRQQLLSRDVLLDGRKYVSEGSSVVSKRRMDERKLSSIMEGQWCS